MRSLRKASSQSRPECPDNTAPRNASAPAAAPAPVALQTPSTTQPVPRPTSPRNRIHSAPEVLGLEEQMSHRAASSLTLLHPPHFQPIDFQPAPPRPPPPPPPTHPAPPIPPPP